MTGLNSLLMLLALTVVPAPMAPPRPIGLRIGPGPFVVSVTSVPGAISATFSAPMDPATLNGTTVILTATPK